MSYVMAKTGGDAISAHEDILDAMPALKLAGLGHEVRDTAGIIYAVQTKDAPGAVSAARRKAKRHNFELLARP